MSLVGYRSTNHPQQVARRGSVEDVDDRATDPAFFGPLHERFGFTVDVAASAANTKLERFFDRRADGLSLSWAGERVWCNPPYSAIGPWAQKAWEEPGCPLVVMLLPANRTEQSWWQALIEPYRDRPGSPLVVEFLPGRLRFLRAGQTIIGPNERPPFGCCLAIWTRIRPDSSTLFGEVPT